MIYNQPSAFPPGGMRVGGVVGGGRVGGVVGGVILPQSYRRLSPGRSRESSPGSEAGLEGLSKQDLLITLRYPDTCFRMREVAELIPLRGRLI